MFEIFSDKLKLSQSFSRYFRKLEADALLAPSSIAKYRDIAPRLVKILGDINVKKINGETIIYLKSELNRKYKH